MPELERVIVPIDFAPKGAACRSSVKLIVEQADLKASRDPEASLYTTPLGAGLGIAIYDPKARVGGILNCMLPSSSLDPRRAAARPGLFLDTGWADLLARTLALKAIRENLRVFVAGAAEIMDETTLFNIGRLNQDFLHEFLSQSGFTVDAENLGGRTNCSMELSIATGEVRLRFCGQHTSKFLCKP